MSQPDVRAGAMSVLATVLKGRRLAQLIFSPQHAFGSPHYQRHNQRRLEHLASLGLDVAGAAVLEVGAGIGDLTSFFLDRGCTVVATDARRRNLKMLRSRFPSVRVEHLDLDHPNVEFDGKFDIVFCYGVLYHLGRPAAALEWIARVCKKMLLLETCVTFGDDELLNVCRESASNPTQSVSGWGCRPTRRYVRNELSRHFEYVYVPLTQPHHEEFPIDWTRRPPDSGLTRAVFVASRQELGNPQLTQDIPTQQSRH